MNEETQRIIEERYGALPDTVQDALSSPELLQKILGIAEKHSLKEKLDDLVFQTSLVLMGFEPLATLPEKMSEFLEIPHDQAEETVKDLKNDVFSMPGLAQAFGIAAPATANDTGEKVEEKEDILAQIENPIPADLPTGADQNQILSKLTNTIKPGPINIPEKKPDAPSGEQGSKPQVSVPKYHGTDPYREPFE